jgi:short-subunit dehydrogenase
MEQKAERPLAVVTGASAGLGAAFARALAARGYDLLLIARRLERLRALAGDIEKKWGVATEPLVADLSQENEIRQVATRLRAERRLEMLVNNAGFGTLGLLHESNHDDQVRMHRLHVLATLELTHASLPGLVLRNAGGIINVSSVAGFASLPGNASYGATKAWMTFFTECIHLELKSIGSRVRVQSLCPGYTYTEFHDVLGVDRDRIMPRGGFWMTAEFVVSESLKGWDKGKWLVIPGWRYRMLIRLTRLAPRKLVHPIEIKLAQRRQSAGRH